ncbi:D-alanyl-D-alanine carboxypeptidase [Rhodobacteraceae bacterium RKSG542]|uniref:serine hydrolase n=1 Tax=Pseudovibrio flavus TaxID=2529854 RepID=UPI0012BD5BD5|nr:serine hydrolase [Pseudovibrio flavus]MTI16399.1 D-alanyl-D-alanine carboxypeptidase [Pseudovibrio flavus]
MGLRTSRPLKFLGKITGTLAAALLVVTLGGNGLISANANPKYAGIVMDAKTGKVLYANNAHARRYPASTTKIMTLYVLFEEMEAGRTSLNTRMKVSKYAASRPPTKIWVKPGGTLRVKDAIYALITRSANDASTVIAEHVSGSEAAFARRMTATARRIGMKNTTFRNPHGLPNSGQVTTAYDLALLARSLQDRFPRYYKFFNTRSYKYGKATLRNHNRLLGKVRGVDGIKTGYINASGFNLVTNVKRDNRHVVAVVLGGRTSARRDAQMVKLINQYMPKATRGRRTAPMLMARAELQFPKVAPAMPTGKPGAAPAPTLIAYASSTTPSAKPNDPIAKLLEGTHANVDASAVPAHASIAPVTLPAQSVQKQNNDLTATVTAALESSAPVQAEVKQEQTNQPDYSSGWHVQISATDSKEKALAILKRAQAATGSALKDYALYTEAVESKDQTLYRARFAGFETKTAAWNACASLKQAKYSCYAVYQ